MRFGPVKGKGGAAMEKALQKEAEKKRAAPKKPAEHNCIENINKDLQSYNSRLTEVVQITGFGGLPPILVATERIKNLRDGKNAVLMFASFCPFCGRKMD